jgi:hypothetical protein
MKSLKQLSKTPYPIHCDEKEKAAKVKTKNTDENKVMYKLTGKSRA